jgi:hypothetical protein
LLAEALKAHGKDWEKIVNQFETRIKVQIMTHVQWLRMKLSTSTFPEDLSLLDIINGPCVQRAIRTT